MKSFLMKLAKKKISNSLKNGSGSDTGSGFFKSPFFYHLMFSGVGFFFFLMIIVVFAVIILGPIMVSGEYLSSRDNNGSSLYSSIDTSDWCSDDDLTCVKQSDQKYYEKLYDVYSSYKEKGVTIDTDLITGTIYYGTSLNNGMFDYDGGEDSDGLVDDNNIHLSDIKELATNMVSDSSIDYTKYRNYLISTYIPKRFSDLYVNSSDKSKAIEKIADEIMIFASGNVKVVSNSSNSCVTYSCDTVFLTGNYAGEYTLDDYVKGVVNAEAGWFNSFTDNYKEVWKAQAIAARSMVLKQYDICSESVPNSQNFQVFKPGWSQEISDAVDETAGMVLMDNNDVFLAQYDAFYEGNNYSCDGDLCYSTYYIRGSGNQSNWDTHVINTYSKFVSHFAAYPNGHGIGMSQWGATYLADNGKNYEQILDYFYADNILIASVGNSCSVNSDTSEYDWRQADPRWGYLSYGTTTLAKVGCNLTSIAIEIAHSGLETTISDFNPGTLFTYMKGRGYLGTDGRTNSYAAFSEVAPDFNYVGYIQLSGSDTQIHDKLVELIDGKNYPIVHVKSGNSLPYKTNNHWVAVVGYTDDDIQIIDPAQVACTRLFTCKPGLDRSNGYGVIDRVVYWN